MAGQINVSRLCEWLDGFHPTYPQLKVTQRGYSRIINGFDQALAVDAVLLRPAQVNLNAPNGPLTSAIENCTPEQFAIVLSNLSDVGVPLTVQYTFTAPRVAGSPSPFLVPVYSTLGAIDAIRSSTITTQENDYSWNTYTVELDLTPTESDEFGIIPTCASLIVNLPVDGASVANAGYSNGLRSSDQLNLCKGGPCGPGIIATYNPTFPDEAILWGAGGYAYNSTSLELFGFEAVTGFFDRDITVNQLAASAGGVLTPLYIGGRVDYVSAQWPQVLASGSTFYMGPGSEIVFSNQDQVPLVIPGAQFMPCTQAPFRSVTIAQGARVNFVTTVAQGQNRPTMVYGANIGFDVFSGAHWSLTGGSIGACPTGIRLRDAKTASVDQTTILPTNGAIRLASPYTPAFTRGVVGVSIQPTPLLTPPGGSSAAGSFSTYAFTSLTVQNYDIGIRQMGHPEAALIGLTAQNTAMTGVDVGYFSSATTPGSTANFVGGSVTARLDGFRALDNDWDALTVNSLTIDAGNRGIYAAATEGFQTVIARNNNINRCQVVGISVVGPQLSLQATGNRVDLNFPVATALQSVGISLLRTQSRASAIASNTVDLGPVRGIGILTSGASSVGISNNDVRLRVNPSVGIETTDGTNVRTNCNTITAVGPSGGQFGEGVLTSDMINVQHRCNLTTDRIGVGLRILGNNELGVYQRNSFQGNYLGLGVGRGPGSTTPVVLIGGRQIASDNVWTGGTRTATHFADPTLSPYQANGFEYRTTDPNFQPGLISPSMGWFDAYTGTEPPTPACAAGCFTLPGGWLTQNPCPADAFESQSVVAASPRLGMQAARAQRKLGEFVIEEYECTDEIPDCYKSLGLIERSIRSKDQLPASKLQQRFADEMALLVTYHGESGGEGDAVELAHALAQMREDYAVELEQPSDYTPFIEDLDAIETCDDESELWRESLRLATEIKISPEDASEAKERLLDIAHRCADTDGPGVYVARQALGEAFSDLFVCGEDAPIQKLTLRPASKKLAAAPNPVQAGTWLSLGDHSSGELWLVAADGRVVYRQASVTGGFVVPAQLPSGIYVVKLIGEQNLSTRIVIQ